MITTFKTGVLTASDRSFRGERFDESGNLLKRVMEEFFGDLPCYKIVPDEKETIQRSLTDWADYVRCGLIITTGGTGLAPRDITPEATREIIDREVPGIMEAIRAEGIVRKSSAMLSRGIAGVRGKCLIINLPGSPRAVAEAFEVLRPVLFHAIELIQGEVSDCRKSLSLSHSHSS